MFTPKSSHAYTPSSRVSKLKASHNRHPYSTIYELNAVPQIKRALKLLETYYAQEIACKQHINEVLQSDLPAAQKEEYCERYQQQIEATIQNKVELLKTMLQFPPHLARYAQKLQEFHLSGGYEESVFIMTKYSEGNSPKDKALERVINNVKQAVKRRGYVPRIGSDKAYYEGVWENVELYLCGCKYAIAIVENKYRDELNPNVVMEWGWMRAMNKPVLYLVENDFDKSRADLNGLIRFEFAWRNPEKGINSAIRNFFPIIRNSLPLIE